MTGPVRTTWADRLQRLAEPTLTNTPLGGSGGDDCRRWIDTFADESRNRRATDAPLLAHLLGLALDPPQAAMSPDVSLWWSLVRPDVIAPPRLNATGPLSPAMGATGLEVWTEAELCAVHALSWRALKTSRESGVAAPAVYSRVDEAAAWLISNIQPDNATQHPWAVHVFIDRWLSIGDDAAHLYADTLIHNTLIGRGRPDLRSACILLDSSRWLHARGKTGSD